MIDKKSIEVYKSIKAPDCVKERILSFDSEGNKKQDAVQAGLVRRTLLRTVSPVAALAACIALMIGIAMPIGNSQAEYDIIINGAKVGEKPVCISQQGEDEVAMAASRRMHVLTVPITLNQEEDAEMSVTSGNLQLLAESGEILEEAPSVQKKEQQSVCWILDGWELDEPAVLTVTADEFSMTYQVYKEDASGFYFITLKGKVN